MKIEGGGGNLPPTALGFKGQIQVQLLTLIVSIILIMTVVIMANMY